MKLSLTCDCGKVWHVDVAADLDGEPPKAGPTKTRPTANARPVEGTQRRLAYSPAEAAALIGTSRKNIYALMSSGALKSSKVGALRRISDDDLSALVAAMQSST